jgi:hypothetical protein
MTKQQKWIAAGCTAVAVLMLATNPDQAAHLRAIKETAALTSSPSTTLAATDFTSAMS